MEEYNKQYVIVWKCYESPVMYVSYGIHTLTTWLDHEEGHI